MYKLYFRNAQGKDQFLGEFSNLKEINQTIKNFLGNKNIVSFYFRRWISAPDHMKIDFGSYSEFFIIKGLTEELLRVIRIGGRFDC